MNKHNHQTHLGYSTTAALKKHLFVWHDGKGAVTKYERESVKFYGMKVMQWVKKEERICVGADFTKIKVTNY